MAKKSRFKVAMGFLIVMLVSVFMFCSVAFAETSDAVVRQVGNNIATAISNTNYELAGGGSIQGNQLFTVDTNNGEGTAAFTFNEGNYAKLSASAKDQLAKDITNSINLAIDENNKETSTRVDEANSETADTLYAWFQSKEGIGSKFLNEILSGTKPDFQSAKKIYAPFQGIVNTILGVIAIVGMALLGIVIILDIFYIAIPPVQMLVSDEGGDHGGGRGSRHGRSKLFSDDAIYAVQQAQDSQDGSKKQALGIYLKRRVVMLIILGICLLYLVSGSIYKLVGGILDLVSGFLGF